MRNSDRREIGEAKMWISSKKWNDMNKKIAELERKARIQQEALTKHLSDSEQENLELKGILSELRIIIDMAQSGIEQTS